MEYNDECIYTGDIVKMENGVPVIIKKNIELSYNSIDDVFYDFQKTFPCLFSLLLEPEKLNDKLKNEYEKIVEDNTFKCKKIGLEGETFILESSIKILLNSNKHKR